MISPKLSTWVILICSQSSVAHYGHTLQDWVAITSWPMFSGTPNVWLGKKSENIPKKLVSFPWCLVQDFCYVSLQLFPQEPAVPCYEQFIFMSHSWLLPLITVFPYWWDSDFEHWENKRHRVGCCSWPNYSHPIGFHPHSSSTLPPNTSKLL